MLSDETRQAVEVIGTVLGSGILAFFARSKGEKSATRGDPAPVTVAASVISDVAIQRLVDALRETTDRRIDSDNRVIDHIDKQTDRVRDLTQSIERVLPDGGNYQRIADLTARLNRIEGTQR